MREVKTGFKIEEVAMRVGVSVQTINRWYKFKKEHPEHHISKLIPEYSRASIASGTVRLWNPDDIWKLVEFRQSVKVGRTGEMGKYHGAGTSKGVTNGESQN